MHILLAEDERDFNRIITRNLVSNGYSVDSCFDGEAALDFLMNGEYDAAVLDVMMPKMDGFEVTRRLRGAGNNTPIIFLTARDSIEDRVKGLDIGGNDYLVKPFAFAELMARLRVLTRSNSHHTTCLYTIADMTVDTSSHTVKRGDTEINLSAKEYAILEYMLANRGVVLSREKIENHVWNLSYEGGSNVVDVYIRYLRKKIDSDFEPKLIHTVRGAGYVLRDDR